MKKYEEPELEVIRFDDVDIITSSSCGVPGGGSVILDEQEL